ncbi:MAG: response regulator [Planctomycetaceae bacterium]|nr:response regulator [Planctomycetaceae bacterium]
MEVFKEIPTVINAIQKALGGEMAEVSGWVHAHFFNLQLLPICDNNTVIGVVGFVLDETPKNLDSSYYQNLTEQIRRIEKEQTARIKSQFLSNISYELRTPLHGIAGCVELLLNTELDKQQRETAELIRISEQHLLAIVNDMISFSHLEKGNIKLQISEFNLPELIDYVMNVMTIQIYSRDLELSYSFITNIPKYVYGDGDKLRQVLIALLNNCLKFTANGSLKLTVAIESCSNKNGAIEYIIRFTILGTNMGISPNQLSNYSKYFSQFDSLFSRETGGVGVGLTLSHQLVRLMGGQINVETEKRFGSKFWFTIPLTCVKKDLSVPSQNFSCNKTTVNNVVDSNKNAENDIKNNFARKFDPKKPISAYNDVKIDNIHKGGGGVILVVEDNLINQIIVDRILSQAGFEYEIVGNGSVAVDLFSKKQFSLILMDCQMPVMNGFEATQKIRKLEEARQATKRVPIIALTADTMPDDIERCLRVGMDAFCSKPVNAQKLIEAIKSFIYA